MNELVKTRRWLWAGLLVATGFAWLSIPAGLPSVDAQDNLLDRFQASQAINGDWRTVEGELVVGADPASRAVIATTAPASYAISVEFTRTQGNDSVGVILPVGSSQCALILSLFGGVGHGIGIIDGKLARANASTVKPGELQTGHPYRLTIEVEVTGDDATIFSTLDGRQCTNWSGSTKSLSILPNWKTPASSNLGLITFSPTTFHALTVSPLDPAMRMTQPIPRPARTARAATNPRRKSILCTSSHGEPASDALKRIANRISFDMTTSNLPVSKSTLASTDVLIVRSPTREVNSQEISAVADYVRGGGALLLVVDEERRTPWITTRVNQIIRPFGVSFAGDTEYLHNCGAFCTAGDILSADCEVPFSGGRAVTGGNIFGYQLDGQGNPAAAFATAKTVGDGGRIVVLADGMAAALMGTPDGQRLSGVPRTPSQTIYWGKDSDRFMSDIIAWLGTGSDG